MQNLQQTLELWQSSHENLRAGTTNGKAKANSPAIEEMFRQWTTAEVTKRLELAQIANSQMRNILDFWEHPQLVARQRVRQVETVGGPIPAVLPGFDIQGVEPRFDPIPDIGQHTDSILSEIGYGESEIHRLRQKGVV